MPKGLRPGVPPCPLEPWSLSPHKLNVSCVGYASLSVESIALSSGDNSYRIEDLSWNPGTVTRIIDTATAFSSPATPTAAGGGLLSSDFAGLLPEEALSQSEQLSLSSAFRRPENSTSATMTVMRKGLS